MSAEREESELPDVDYGRRWECPACGNLSKRCYSCDGCGHLFDGGGTTAGRMGGDR